MVKERVQSSLQQQHMIEPGDVILVACSGGADSMALLLTLMDLRTSLDFSVEVVHIEHGIRGQESKEDAVFVENFCKRKKLMCHVVAVDVPARAKELGCGLEETARKLRYEAICNVAKLRHITKIALAHHANDQAETLLMHLIRGSGLRGLCGMRAQRTLGQFILLRPMLGVTREEIEAYLNACKQEYRTDATNEDTAYQRNRIRANVIPELNEVNPKAIWHIEQTAEQLQEICYYFDEACTTAEKELMEICQDGVRISIARLAKLPIALRRELLLRCMYRASGCRQDFAREHVLSVEALTTKQSGKRICLPHQVLCYSEYDRLYFVKQLREVAMDCTPKAKAWECYISEEELAQLEQQAKPIIVEALGQGSSLELSVFSKELLPEDFKKKPYTKYLDYDKIKNGFSIRTRRMGDYLILDSLGRHKKLSNYFIDEKIPESLRDEQLLLVKGKEVICCMSGRMSQTYLIGDTTTKVLSVSYIGG